MPTARTLWPWLKAMACLAGLGLVVVYALATACSIPGGLILTVGAGFMFGSLLATFWVVLGATLGATGIFLAARSALGGFLRQRAGPFLQKMEAGFQANELNYLLVLRLIPLFPFWLVNIVPAFLGVSLRNYVIGTFRRHHPRHIRFCLCRQHPGRYPGRLRSGKSAGNCVDYFRAAEYRADRWV